MLAETPRCFYRPTTTTTRTSASTCSSGSSTSGIKERMPYTNSAPDLMGLSASAAGKSAAAVGAGVRKDSMTSVSSMPSEKDTATASGTARMQGISQPAAQAATVAVPDESIAASGTASKECNTCCSSADENNFDQQQQPPPQAQIERMSSQLLPQTLPPSAASICASHTNGGIATDTAAADNTSVTTSPASATYEAHRTLQTRGQTYPRAQHQFAFDVATPRSHWRRCNALSDNVAEYLAAHGLPADRARRELTREYCQRYRFVRPVSEGAGGGAVFEIDTDWGRRVQVYEVDDSGWDEECTDRSALFGGHARGSRQERMRRSAAASTTSSSTSTAGTSSSQDPTTTNNATNDKNSSNSSNDRNKRKIHRRSQWEGRSFIASTLSSNGGLIERTERYLTSASSYLTTDERSSLPPSTDDTIQVVERTYSPEGDDVPPEIVTCREVFIRCYHHPTHRAGVNPAHAESGGPCCSIPVRSCAFEDVVVADEANDAGTGTTNSSTIASFTRKDQVRVRTVLIPVESGCREDNIDDNSARRYRVCIEGDATDVETRGLLGLLSDAVSELSTAQDVLETLDVVTVCQRVGIAAAEPSRCRMLEASLRKVQKQISSLLN